jgi:hypothetical protein
MRELLEKHIITGDETLIHRYKLESKQYSMQWKYTMSPVSMKFWSWHSAHRILPTVFWDSQGPLCEDYQLVQQRYGITVTSILTLQPAICTKQRGKQSVLLLHDNPCPYNSHPSNKELDIFYHPACSSDLTSSNCHLFGPSQEALRGWQSPNNEMQFITCFAHNLNPIFWKSCRPIGKVYWEAWRPCSEIYL